MTRPLLVTGLLCAVLPSPAGSQGLGATWDSVARILQAPGALTGGYYRYTLPRRDITLRIAHVVVAPALALGTWAGFSGEPNDATMMGDLVLTAAELKAVLAELAHQGIAVTAVHNHLAGETPQITYVHIHGEGPATVLAGRLDRVLRRTATPRPVVAAPPPPPTIDTALVFGTLGRSGRAQGAVAQVSFVLVPGTVTLDGRALNPAMAYGSPVNVQQVSASRAVSTGDFAVTADRLDALLSALAAHGIAATAVHSHLIGESPRLSYVHFWADGPLPDVLRGLRAALDAVH
jgi:hypothetical protein